MQRVPQEEGSGQCLDPLSSGYTEITAMGLYGPLSSARSEPDTCLCWKAVWLAVVRNLSYLKIFPVPPLSVGQAPGENVMRHLSPAPGWAKHVTLAQKGLKAAVPLGLGSAALLGQAGEKPKQGRCCWSGCAWSDGGEGAEGLWCGHMACWSAKPACCGRVRVS